MEGKFLLFIFITSSILSSLSDPLQVSEPVTETPTEFTNDQTSTEFKQSQQVLLHRLIELVQNLTETVSRLESKLSDSPTKLSVVNDEKPSFDLEKDKVTEKGFDERSVEQVEVEKDLEKGGAVSVTKYSRFWSEKFQFVSAVKLDSDATCINVLPDRDTEGLTKYVAVGNQNGRVYIFSRNGDVLFEFQTTSNSTITAMVSYMSVYRNESVVVTGHQSGVILLHRVFERANGEEWSPPVMETLGRFEIAESERVPVTLLEVHHIGRLKYILSTDTSGRIRVFRENGTLYGSVMPKSRPLAFLKQRLMFLTETGAGSLDLKSMRMRETECEGLNRSLARNYVFDSIERSKAFGFTSDGDLVHVLLLGDVGNFKCRVRSKKKLDSNEPLAFQSLKGYLIIIGEDKVFVFNVSTQHYARTGGPRLLFSVYFDEIRSSFLNHHGKDDNGERRKMIQLIASDREELVVLGLGDGYVGIYRSNLPVFKGESSSILWTSPVLFFIIFLFVSWQFFAKKKHALTSWGPDEPFTSTSSTIGGTQVLSGSVDNNRSYVDTSSRSGDIMDLRSGGLRGGVATRYASPATSYSGGGYRPISGDPNPRPALVEPSYRTPVDLRYRGSTLETTVFPKRRESLFANSQVIDESN